MMNSELLLLDYLKTRHTAAEEELVVHINSSQLSEENKREHKIQLIQEALRPLAQQEKCKSFHIFNEDFFVFFKEENRDFVNTALLKIKFYFADDSGLAAKKIPLLAFYSVRKEHDKLAAYIKGIYGSGEAQTVDEIREFKFLNDFMRKNSGAAEVDAGETEGVSKPRYYSERPLTPKLLGMIENNLEKADFANMIRRQPVCVIFGKSAPQPLFDEVFVAISDLQETMMPDISLTSAPWLFKHLTEVLDKGVLASIRRHEYGSLKQDFSVNINAASIISSDFGKFDENINPDFKSTVILELNPSDVFSDLHTFIIARNFAKSKGYKLCIDSVPIDLLEYIDREKLGIDLVKILYSQKVPREINTNKDRVMELVNTFGYDKIIMRNVDDESAVEIGQSLGISMFQGRYINQLLSSDPRRRRVGTTLLHK